MIIASFERVNLQLFGLPGVFIIVTDNIDDRPELSEIVAVSMCHF